MCFIDDQYLNFELQTWNLFLIQMKTTKKRQKFLHALEACNMIYANNGFKRMLDVEVAPGIIKKVSVYSISKKIIDSENLNKIDELLYANYLFTENETSSINLRPMITNDSRTLMCGQYMNLDLNYHQLISGDPRSGKTTYESEQAVAAAKNDEPVLVIDNDGSWSEDILKKHFSKELIEKYFSFWSIPNQGLPINCVDLSNCNNIPEKKNLIFSILSAAARRLVSFSYLPDEKEKWAFIFVSEAINDTITKAFGTPDALKITTYNAAPGVKGDANGDGQVDMSDVVLIMQALANPNKYGIDGTDPKHISENGFKYAD